MIATRRRRVKEKEIPKPPPSRNRIMANQKGKTVEVYYLTRGQTREGGEESRPEPHDLRE